LTKILYNFQLKKRNYFLANPIQNPTQVYSNFKSTAVENAKVSSSNVSRMETFLQTFYTQLRATTIHVEKGSHSRFSLEVLFIVFIHAHTYSFWILRRDQWSFGQIRGVLLRPIFKHLHVHLDFFEDAISRQTPRGRGLFVGVTDDTSRLETCEHRGSRPMWHDERKMCWQRRDLFHKLIATYTCEIPR